MSDYNNLDKPAGRRSHELTRGLKEIMDSDILWDEFGIDDEITVRHLLFAPDLTDDRAAIHDTLSTSGHSRDVVR